MNYLVNLKKITWIIKHLAVGDNSVYVSSDVFNGINALESKEGMEHIILIEAPFLNEDEVIFNGKTIISNSAYLLDDIISAIEGFFGLKSKGSLLRAMGGDESKAIRWISKSNDGIEMKQFDLKDSKIENLI